MSNSEAIEAAAPVSLPNHARFSAGGVKLAFGLRWDGKLIHISQTERRKPCGCFCPAPDCRRPLIAHQPESGIAPSFFHAPLSAEDRAAGKPPNCRHGEMTALHRHAQELLEREKGLMLAPIGAEHGGKLHTAIEAQWFEFERVELEVTEESVVPDVVLHKGTKSMHVEIFVTHHCGPEKRAKLKTMDRSSMEIDLRGLRDAPLDTLDDAILRTAPRLWIHNRAVEKFKRSLEAQAVAAEKRDAEAKKRQADGLRTRYQSARRRVMGQRWQEDENVQRLSAAEALDILGGRNGWAGYFSVHPNVWKALVVTELLGGDALSAHEILAELRQRSWLASPFGSGHSRELIDAAGLPVHGAQATILGYLNHLKQIGVAVADGEEWECTSAFKRRISEAERQAERKREAEIARESRRKELQTLLDGILAFAPDDERANFDLVAWLATPDGYGVSPAAAVELGDEAWRRVLSALKRIASVLRDECDDEASAEGLPIAGALEGIAEMQRERAAQRQRDQQAEMHSAAAARVADLEREAALCGELFLRWVASPNADLNGATPLEASAQSPEKHALAVRALVHLHASWANNQEWRERLHRRGRQINASKAEFLLTHRAGDLPGNAIPVEYVRDQSTFDECVAYLKRHKC